MASIKTNSKYQHYISRFLLDKFCIQEQGGQSNKRIVWYFDKEFDKPKNKIIKKSTRRIMGQCDQFESFERDSGEILDPESELCKLEDRTAPIIKYGVIKPILAGGIPQLQQCEEETIKEYIYWLYSRNPHNNTQMTIESSQWDNTIWEICTENHIDYESNIEITRERAKSLVATMQADYQRKDMLDFWNDHDVEYIFISEHASKKEFIIGSAWPTVNKQNGNVVGIYMAIHPRILLRIKPYDGYVTLLPLKCGMVVDKVNRVIYDASRYLIASKKNILEDMI